MFGKLLQGIKIHSTDYKLYKRILISRDSTIMCENALALIKQYDSESSEDEVVQHNKSSKRTSSEITTGNSTKRSKIKLPVPFIETESVQCNDLSRINDSSLHDGRIRTFAHERGNWATYVYIPYDEPDLIKCIANIITKTLSTRAKMKPVDHYHISLTKTVVLKHHWIELFVDSIREKVSFIKRFIIVYDQLNVYCNEERTRTFIGLDVKSGCDTLSRLVNQLDNCLEEFQLPVYYKNPSFHITLAWCVGDQEAEIRSVLKHLQSCVEKEVPDYTDRNLYNYVTCLEAKCGNKLFNFHLC